MSSSARFVVYPPSDHAVRYSASVSTPSRNVSTDTPFHVVSSFDHFVTQWMSTVNVSAGSCTNSSQGHDTGSSTAPCTVKLHSSSGVGGVGPALSTGKASVTYGPGGTRAGSAVGRRRPPKPRLIGDIAFVRYSTSWPFAVSLTSMFPRVAFEYGHTL